MNDATKVFIGIATGVGLAAIGTLIYILASGEGSGRDTSGLMSVCWQSNGLANFNPTSCRNPSHIEWPGRVRIQENQSPEETQMIREVAHQLNSEIGCDILEVVPSAWDQPYDVVVLFNVPQEAGDRDLGGATSFSRLGLDSQGEQPSQRAYVGVFASGFSQGLLRLILKHELGHVLGLDHDTLSNSIMRPAQPRSGPGDSLGFASDQVGLTPEDRELLRGRWALCR